VAGLAVGRADAVAELRDLERGPVEFRKSRDQPCHNTGLAHAAGMPADDNECHGFIVAVCRDFRKALRRVISCQETSHPMPDSTPTRSRVAHPVLGTGVLPCVAKPVCADLLPRPLSPWLLAESEIRLRPE